MKAFVLRVFDYNRETGNVSASQDQIMALVTGLKAGKYSGLEIRTKERNELIRFIPAMYCAFLDYGARKNEKGGMFYLIETARAVKEMEATKCAS